ncbi:MAG: winged helix-turn-helix domain-containing protein [Oryzihumus sp.]
MARRAPLKKEITLTDPKAIRAVAHPARQRIIDELYGGTTLTATDAARLCGLTPSAMSYHLRALEQWGIIVRDNATADGRERPWRAPARSLHISSQAQAGASKVAAKAFAAAFIGPFLEDLESWAASDRNGRKGSDMAKDRLWLSQEEAAELNREVKALLERFGKGRTPDRHPEGAKAVTVFWSLFPKQV